MNPAWRYAITLVVGFGAAWYIQGLRWGSDIDERDRKVAQQIADNATQTSAKLQAAQRETEEFRKTLIDYKAGSEREISDLERRVNAGPERLYIKANCPTVPAAGAVSSGTGGGTAELDASSSRTYFDLERGLAEQYGLLQFCRQELRKRSQQKAP